MTEGETAPRSRRTLWLLITGGVVVVGVPFLMGVYRGYNEAAADPAVPVWLIAGWALLGAFALFGLWRAFRQPPPAAPVGLGERAEAANKRRFWTILGTLFVVGMAVGAGSAAFESDPGGFLTGRLPRGFAIAAASVTVVALTIGSILFFKRIDEVERSDNLWAAAIGGNTLMIVYPAWFFLWKGDVVREPSHTAMILILYGVMVSAYLYRKFR